MDETVWLEPGSPSRPTPSGTGGPAVSMTVQNLTGAAIKLFWSSFDDELELFATIPAGGRHTQGTYGQHVWLARDAATDASLVLFEAPATSDTVVIRGAVRNGNNGATRDSKGGGADLDPPCHGTVWFTPMLILPTDATALVSLTPMGRGDRTMFDRRSESFDLVEQAWLFAVTFGAEQPQMVEVQVNPEFATAAEAAAEVGKYCPAIGRLPGFMLRDVKTVWIHRGDHGFGGGNENLLIHTARGEAYIQDGVLEEAFVHEATHTSLDAEFLSCPGWLAAMAADGGAISTYARDHPGREDLAESMGPYFAASERHGRSDRVDPVAVESARRCIPNRIKFLDGICHDRGWTMAVKA